MSFGLRPFGVSPYGLLQPDYVPQNYTLTAETGAFTLTGQDAGLNIGRMMAADTGVFTLTGNDAELTASVVAASTAAGRGKKRKRLVNAEFGNKDFLGSRRNSRPGVAEEEMREVLAAVKAKAVPIPIDAIEDDDEEAILWLV